MVNKDTKVGLSDSDKKKLYPTILDYLDNSKQKGYTSDEIYDIINKHHNNIPKKTPNTVERFERLIIVFLALYKAKNRLDLDAQLSALFPLKNLSEIKNLTDEIKIELKLFTGEDLYKNLETIPINIRNDELINKYDDIIPEEKQIFVNNEMDNKKVQAEHDTEDLNQATYFPMVSRQQEYQKGVQSFVLNNQKNKKGDKISILKRKIRDIDWEEVSDDWVVDKIINKFTKMTKSIKLNPYKDCDKDSNPLYMHKEWLEKLYKGLGLSDRKIGKICGISHWTIGDWRKRLKIETRETKDYYITKQGYKMILMPLDYKHPQRKTTSSGKQWILEHRLVMENFLSQNPHLEVSKKYLIEGKYLKSGTEIHHINQDRLDNRIENLWLYPTKKIHSLAQESLNQCFSALIKLKQVTFNDGEYTYDDSFDYRNRYDGREIREITKPLEFRLPFENIDEIKDEIKKWDWGEISDNWTFYKYRGGDKQSKKYYIE